MQYQQYARARLSRPAYFILGCLSHGPRDAVALCEAIEQAEGLYIEPGTLYSCPGPVGAAGLDRR